VATTDLLQLVPGLERNQHGWWERNRASAVSYPEGGNALCFLIEESSFWFQHRNLCILEALRQFPPPGTFFDIGGGNGCVARAIQDAGLDVVLVEPGIDGVRNAVHRGIRHVLRGTLDDADIAPGSLPAAGLFDVLEHVSEDLGFLKNIHQLLVPGGRLYVTVPAYQALWSGEDELSGHARRYALAELCKVLERSGHTVEFATYFFGFLPLPILLQRAIPHRLGFKPRIAENKVRSDHEIGSPVVRGIVDGLNRRELARIAQRRPIRMGGSCLAVARKMVGG